MTGRPRLLLRDLPRQLARLLHDPRRSGLGSFGPGMRFQYLPDRGPGHFMNVDSAEYSNIVLSFLRVYDQARQAGMPPPSAARRTLLRAWAQRVLAGYWTHAGYLNWDSGLGFARWHQAKKLGLAHEALIGIAQTPALQPSPAWSRWAKWLLDRGLSWYEDQPRVESGLPDPVFFKLFTVPQGVASARLAAAREEANALRAVAAGLGSASAEEPPSLYAYDPDTGRLAVTTSAYNTAVVPVNGRAFPYGGIELARLFDGEQEVAAGIGGRAPAAFGILVRDPAGRRLFSSQTGRPHVARAITPLRLSRAPRGVGVRASSRAGRAFAGPFGDLRATGTLTLGPFSARATHRFTKEGIETRWRLRRLRGSARLRADALFPSWGREARLVAVLRDGTRVSLAAGAIALARVAYFQFVSERSGYVVRPILRPAGAVARLLPTTRQPSAPDPGPTLAVEFARGVRWRRPRFAVRLAIARDGSEAVRAAARLGAVVRKPAGARR